QQSSRATQEFVPIDEVRDGILVLDDGSLRAVLMASSINFALKSEDEQRSVLMQFQNFLNSLDFSMQFSIQSRNLDIRPYLEDLEKQHEKKENDLMKTQISQYIDFIRTFTEDTNVMQKIFFVVVPYNRAAIENESGIIGSIRSLIGKNSQDSNEESFQEARNQLDQRVQLVRQGLIRTGVRVTQLGTEENIELFYRLFNPGNLKQGVSNSDF
ncbi:MAG: hypothetical protein WD552_00845, partial [Candidatus Paceibacterota bacterium]